MIVDSIFISLHARDFSGLSIWYSRLLERRWARVPMPSCHEWDLMPGAFFQVLDDTARAGKGEVALHVADLDGLIGRLRHDRIQIPDPVRVEAFATLRYSQFPDPEGNLVSLIEGR